MTINQMFSQKPKKAILAAKSFLWTCSSACSMDHFLENGPTFLARLNFIDSYFG
jgi:hypothetical protein